MARITKAQKQLHSRTPGQRQGFRLAAMETITDDMQRDPGNDGTLARDVLRQVGGGLERSLTEGPPDPEKVVGAETDRLRGESSSPMGDVSGRPITGFDPLPDWRKAIFGDTPESIGVLVPMRDQTANPAFGG